jgi:hypothetical protein
VTSIEYETDDLAATLDTISADADPAHLDAAASDLLRWLAREEREIKRYGEAEDAELERICFRYEQLAAPHKARAAQITEAIAHIARVATFPGKSRSRKVGYGTYGLRKVGESVKIVDKAEALSFARERGLIELRTEEHISITDLKPHVLAIVHAAGEVPAGFEHIAERDEPVVKTMEAE